MAMPQLDQFRPDPNAPTPKTGMIVGVLLVAAAVVAVGYWIVDIGNVLTGEGKTPMVASYIFPISRQQTLEALQEFRRLHPEMVLPDSIDVPEGEEGDVYRTAFRRPSTGEYFVAFFRAKSETTTELGLVGMADPTGQYPFVSPAPSPDNPRAGEMKRQFEEEIVRPFEGVVAARREPIVK